MVKNIIPEMATVEIEHLYERWKRAIMNADLELLDKICDDNFSWTNSVGITCRKDEQFYRITSGNAKYLSWTNNHVSITVSKDIAILRTRETLKMIVYNQRAEVVQDVVLLFVKQNGKWLLAGGEEYDLCSEK